MSMEANRKPNTVELQWFEHTWNHEICSRQGQFELMSVNDSVRRHNRNSLFQFLYHDGYVV